jgi:cobalt-precorrin 5A hydrolase
VRLVACTAEELERAAGRVLIRSARVLQAKGLPSIAEAAALAVAGANAQLLGARVATERATCAIAIGQGAIGEGR